MTQPKLYVFTSTLTHQPALHHHSRIPTLRDMLDNHASPTALQRVHIHSPITALAFYPSLAAPTTTTNNNDNNTSTLHLLSGQDTHLYIHTLAGHALIASIQIFPAHPIHGITTSAAGDVLVWGGPWIALLARERITQLLRLAATTASSSTSSSSQPAATALASDDEILCGTDWIYHAAFVSRTLAAVVTAHNEVRSLHIARGSPQPSSSSSSLSSSVAVPLAWGRVRAPPSSRPILYAAQLVWAGPAEVLVAAGTAFGEIVVWRCRVGASEADEDADVDVEVLYVFTGHEGSIFGVDMSPVVMVAGKPTRLLASCSDDRTIRVWDISDSTVAWRRLGSGRPASKADKSSDFTAARETGFGENGVAGLEAQAGCVSSEPVAVAMGHVSRIWSARFAPSTPSERPVERMMVYSFGEDGTAQRWRLDVAGLGVAATLSNGTTGKGNGSGGLAATFTHETIVHRHSGKHIWSSAILPPSSISVKTLVVTGGSDGKINMAEDVPAEVDTRSVMLDISGSEVVRSFPDAARATALVEARPRGTKRNKTTLEDEPFLMYALLSDTSTIATTSTGRLFCGSLRGSELAWSEIVMPQAIRDDLRQYQIVRRAGPGIALLGSTSGILYVYHRDGMVEQVCKVPGKISDIFTFPVNDLAGLGLWDGDGPAPLLPIVVSTMGSSLVTLVVLSLTAYGLVVQQQHAIELETGFSPTAIGCCGEFLIFGSRAGALLVYKVMSDGETIFERVARADRPLTKDAVSTIVPLPSKTGTAVPYFLTTSRDGRYRIYELTTHPILQFHLRHEAVPPLGPMIESALFTPATASAPPELILAGFRSKYFVVWNETRQLELAHVDCGGAFRSFTHRVDPVNPVNVAFIWTRASRTCVYAQTALSQRVLKHGGHGREIKAVAVCNVAGLLATGAEDTTVRIWRYQADDKGTRREAGLSCLAVIEKHTTGIQCLKWAGAHYLLSSSGNEELYIWRITHLDKSAYDGLAVVCEGVYADKTRDGDLRIMGFDVAVLPPQGTSDDEVLCLSLVLSNSTLRTYRYSKEGGFALLAEGRYTGACLMHLRHLRVALAGGELHVLTTATDGHIALWKMSAAHHGTVVQTAVYELVEVARLHQSSIKSLALRSSWQQGHVVVTGGDDNALGCVALAWSPTRSCYTIRSRSLANGAHAAAVTGLCIVDVDASPDKSGSLVRVYTTSSDQRVKSWQIVFGGDARLTRIRLVQDQYSAVADSGDLGMLAGGRKAVVVGVGMEVWELPSK